MNAQERIELKFIMLAELHAQFHLREVRESVARWQWTKLAN